MSPAPRLKEHSEERVGKKKTEDLEDGEGCEMSALTNSEQELLKVSQSTGLRNRGGLRYTGRQSCWRRRGSLLSSVVSPMHQ